MLQAGAGPMLWMILRSTLQWAMKHRPVILPSAWSQAVLAAETSPGEAEKSIMFTALEELLQGIITPVLILIGELSGQAISQRACISHHAGADDPGRTESMAFLLWLVPASCRFISPLAIHFSTSRTWGGPQDLSPATINCTLCACWRTL